MYSCILLCLLASVSVDVFGNSWEWVSFTGSECPSAASVEVMEQSGNTALVEMNLEGVYTQERRGEGRSWMEKWLGDISHSGYAYAE